MTLYEVGQVPNILFSSLTYVTKQKRDEELSLGSSVRPWMP